MKANIEYDFIFDGARTNHQLVLVNNTARPILLKSLKIKTNAEITTPWQALGNYWNYVKVDEKNGADSRYVYELDLTQNKLKPLSIPPGRTPVLEYSVYNVKGQLKNIALPPDSVEVRVNDQAMQTLPISDRNPNSDPHPGKQLIFYNATWGQYAFARTTDNQNFKDLNRVNYAFIGFKESGEVASLDTWADQLELPKLNLAKKRNPYLKLNLAFGGWINAGQRMDAVFAAMAKDPIARAKFIKNAVDAVVQVGADGIDIDWEYVGKDDAKNFVALITELRKELKRVPNARLTIAAPAGKDNIEALTPEEWKIISDNVDAISVMTYDYFGSFSKYNEFHSAWRLDPNSPYNHQQGEAPYFCVEKTLELYAKLGIDMKKVVLGIPNYCRAVVVDDLGQYSGLYQEVKDAPPGENGGEGGIYGWDAILKLLRKQPSPLDQLGVKSWNYFGPDHPLCQNAQMSLLVGQLPDNRYVVLNFVEPNTAYQRAKYAADHGLGGAMVWANYFEPLRYEDSFMNAISCGLENKPYHFTTKLDAKTHAEVAKHITTERKSDLKQRLDNHVTELKSAEVRSSIAYKVLSFIGNILPTRLVFAPVKELILGMVAKMLNRDVEAKTKAKIDTLIKISQAHTNEEAQAIIDANLNELNQHRNPIKRLLVSILPSNFVKNSKSLKTESLRLAEKFKQCLPALHGLKTQVFDMSEVHPPLEPHEVIVPPQAPYPANMLPLYPAYSQMLPVYSGVPTANDMVYGSNPYMMPMFIPSAPMYAPSAPSMELRPHVVPVPVQMPASNAVQPPSYSEATRFRKPGHPAIIPQSFFSPAANMVGNQLGIKLHGEGPHHEAIRPSIK